MAGAGAKLFTSGSVLTADQVNTFLMDQSIMRFTSTTTRDAAFGGAGEPTLAEGMFAYTTDTNTLWLYDGSAWVAAVNASSLNGIGEYTAYTPTWSGLTVGNGTNTFAYAQVNKFVHVFGTFEFGSTSAITASGPSMTLPLARIAMSIPTMGTGNYADSGVATYLAYPISVATNTVQFFAPNASGTYITETGISATVPFTWGTGDRIMVNLFYRAA